MEKVLHVDFHMYLPDIQYVFSNCCSYFFQHFSWEFLMIGILLSALLSMLIQLMWVSLQSAWSISISVCLLLFLPYINQWLTTNLIIFRHHFIDLIYGNCFLCMLNNATCTAKVLNDENCMDKWVSVLQTQCNSSFSFSIFISIYKHFYSHFFPHFTIVCCVLQSEGIVQDHEEENVGGNHNI